MRKTMILLSLSLIFGSSVFAQSLSLKYGDDIVTNDSVYISGEPSDDVMELHLKVKNLTDKEIGVKVRKNEISLVEGTVNTFCWGNCFPPYVYSSPSPRTIAANSTDFNGFSGDYEPSGMEGTSIITYTFFNAQDEADSVMVTAFYQAGASGINNISRGNENIRIYPNPVKDIINIEFGEALDFPFNIRIIDFGGRTLKEMRFKESTGSLSIPAEGLEVNSAILLFSYDQNVVAVKRILFR